MIKYGGKGHSTRTGADFETSAMAALVEELGAIAGFHVVVNKSTQSYDIVKDDVVVFRLMAKKAFYKHFLLKLDPHCENKISGLLLPDAVLINMSDNKIHVFEMKTQQVEGSVDEKLQTCDFKKKQYKKLISDCTGWDLSYTYLLSEWFKQSKYKDVLDYVQSSGCDYCYLSDLAEHVEGIAAPYSALTEMVELEFLPF